MVKFFIWASIGEAVPGGLMQEARNPALMTALYIAFLIMANLLLMNLLIGLISNTFKKDMERGRQVSSATTLMLVFASLSTSGARMHSSTWLYTCHLVFKFPRLMVCWCSRRREMG